METCGRCVIGGVPASAESATRRPPCAIDSMTYPEVEMPSQRVLAIGLDGLEVTLAERLMAAGEMPALAALRGRAARFLLDHGPAQRTGLAWEHMASGRSPESARRWAAVEFDPATYRAWQEGARFTPW